MVGSFKSNVHVHSVFLEFKGPKFGEGSIFLVFKFLANLKSPMVSSMIWAYITPYEGKGTSKALDDSTLVETM